MLRNTQYAGRATGQGLIAGTTSRTLTILTSQSPPIKPPQRRLANLHLHLRRQRQHRTRRQLRYIVVVDHERMHLAALEDLEGLDQLQRPVSLNMLYAITPRTVISFLFKGRLSRYRASVGSEEGKVHSRQCRFSLAAHRKLHADR